MPRHQGCGANQNPASVRIAPSTIYTPETRDTVDDDGSTSAGDIVCSKNGHRTHRSYRSALALSAFLFFSMACLVNSFQSVEISSLPSFFSTSRFLSHLFSVSS
jgi:hypothetical protein